MLYDTTLRDGTQGEGLVLSLADKLKIARRLDEAGFTYIEGGWPGSNPKDVEFFAAARGMTWRARADRGLRLHPPPRQPPGRRPQPAGARGGRDARGHDLRQELAAPRDRGPGRHARGEPGHDRRLGGATAAARGRKSIYDAEHFFDGYQGRPRLRPGHAARRPRRRARQPRAVRHQRRHAHRRAGEHRARRDRGARRSATTLRHPRPRRRRPRGGQLAGGRAGRRTSRAGHHQRLRRALRQRQPGHDLGRSRAQDGSLDGAPGRRPGGPHRALALRRRGGQRGARRRTSRTWARAPSPTRVASTARPPPRCATATSTSTRRGSATRRAWWSRSWAGGSAPSGGPSSSAIASRASSIRASCRA